MVAMGEMVQSSPIARSQPSNLSGSGEPGPVSTSYRPTPPRLVHSEPSRMVSLRKSLLSKGLSEDSVNLITSAQRPSTRQVYDNHWKRWSLWCEEHQVDPLNPTEVDVVNHLASLANRFKVSPSYVRVRRSAISSTLSSMGLTDFSSSPFISKAVRGLSNLSVKTKKRTPDWDIRVVLAFLMSDEFEPLHQVSLRNLTWKTSFLVALATGRRASEVLNFSGILGDVATERDGSISLCFLPE